jgi:glutamine synthetase
MHVNISVSKEGENDSVELRRHMIAGILSHLREIAAFSSPHVNSYERLGSFEAPKGIGWGYGNRSLAIRIPRSEGPYARIEVRTADASANPYLLYTLLCRAACEGIDKKLDPGKPTNINAFDGFDGPCLPTSLSEAISLAEESVFVRKTIPAPLLESYLNEARQEVRLANESDDVYGKGRQLLFPYL